jgi:hypothetical protein
MKWECEHCGSELSNLVAYGESQPKQMQAVGWCPNCQATAWSKIVEKRKSQKPQGQTQPASSARATLNYPRRP